MTQLRHQMRVPKLIYANKLDPTTMDSAFDVPDATDWLNTPLKEFADLENALHCQICKEFYDTPMITSCAHTFCSKCIRTSLSADGKCPACRSADQASKLRNNWAIQEVVSTFLAARNPALEVARKSQEESSTSGGQRKRKRKQQSDNEASSRTTRSKSRRIAASQSSQTETIELDATDSDGDFEPDIQKDEPPEDGLVECPLGCGKRMKIEAVEPHLDRCEDEKEQERRSKSRTPANGFGGLKRLASDSSRPSERINELNYSLLKDSAMTKKMNELGIPSWGSKQLMINRHREWVNLWNANCDSSRPRTKRELLNELDIWERTQGGKAPNPNGLSNSVMRKDFDGIGWAKKNQDDFSRLIADARRKKHNPAMQPKSTEKEQGDTPDQPVAELPSDTNPGAPTSTSKPMPTSESSKPYADDPVALSLVHEKVVAAKSGQASEPLMNANSKRTAPPLSTHNSGLASTTAQEKSRLSLEDTRKVLMLTLPEQAFRDTDGMAEQGDNG